MNPADEALFNAKVVGREDLTPELCVIRVAPEKGEAPDFLPGQYATLGLPPAEDDTEQQAKKGLGRFWLRPYSIASPPSERRFLEFYVALVEDGAFTPKMWALQEGDGLWMGPKCKGTFTMEHLPRDQHIVTISTGTGLAPFMSMLNHYRGQDRWKTYTVIHGTRKCNDLGYRRELEAVVGDDPTVRYIPTCSREPDEPGNDWKGLRGRVNVAIETKNFRQFAGIDLDPADCQVFLCGNPQMIEDIEHDLHQRGFTTYQKKNNPDGNIHHEKYW
ncbi:MAG: ferredoxin--NADP reductase [Planctomycetota bacterium]